LSPDADDLSERLEALLEEARTAKATDALRPALERFLAETRPAAAATADGEVPERFGMIGDAASMKRVFDLIERVGPADVAVLVLGETGTGKELVARAVHDVSSRKGRFVAENCAAVPANLFESELFGHKRGSFTGAVADRDGHFVAADGGTLFLDEIGDMPLDMQAKLLRALETGEVRPVGSNAMRRVDVRIVAATNRDLERAVKARTFRQDLFYRLNVVRIELPPLRERRADIPLLGRTFLTRIAAETGEVPRTLGAEAMGALEAWEWPGNVRQLENEMRRVTALGRGQVELEDLSPAIRARVGSSEETGDAADRR